MRRFGPAGALEAQCGGIGNLEEFLNSLENVNGDERFAPYLRGIASTWNFASPGDTECASRARASTGARCWLEERIEQPREPREFLRTVCLRRHLDRLPEDLREAYLDAVLEVHPAAADAGLRAAEHLGPQAGLVPAAVRLAERLAELLSDPAGMAERLVACLVPLLGVLGRRVGPGRWRRRVRSRACSARGSRPAAAAAPGRAR